MIRRLLFILMGIIVAVLGIFAGLCLAVFMLLRRVYLAIRRAITGEANPEYAARGDDVIEGSFTEVSPTDFTRIDRP